MKIVKGKKLFIVWARETELSRYLAADLGAEVRQVYYKKFLGVNLPAFLRYLAQGAVSLFILFKARPAVVIAQNPPVFAPLTVMLYCKLSGAKFAIDSHTAAFLDSKWIKFYPLFKFAALRASLNSCHNYKNLEILKSWGAEPSLVMQFYNPVYDLKKLNQPMLDEKVETALAKSKLPVIMVNRFADDDDWETVVKTAEFMPEADFFLTGDSAGAKLENLPANVVLTGYLLHEEFLKLVLRARLALALTLRPDTVLWSVRECLALNKPFVVTDSEVLKYYYGQTGVLAKPADARGLKEKIIEAIKNETEIKNKIKKFLLADEQRWNREIQLFNNFLK